MGLISDLFFESDSEKEIGDKPGHGAVDDPINDCGSDDKSGYVSCELRACENPGNDDDMADHPESDAGSDPESAIRITQGIA